MSRLMVYVLYQSSNRTEVLLATVINWAGKKRYFPFICFISSACSLTTVWEMEEVENDFSALTDAKLTDLGVIRHRRDLMLSMKGDWSVQRLISSHSWGWGEFTTVLLSLKCLHCLYGCDDDRRNTVSSDSPVNWIKPASTQTSKNKKPLKIKERCALTWFKVLLWEVVVNLFIQINNL